MRKNVSVVIFAGVLVIILLVAGFFTGSLMATTANADSNIGFAIIKGGVWDIVHIVYDIETGVMYTRSNGTNNAGTMTVMLNPDGTPRIYEGFGGK